MIKLVKFLLLIVFIAPTYAWECITKNTKDACTKTVGCGWVDGTVPGTCTRCNDGEYSTVADATCLPCSNGPTDAYYYGYAEDNGNNDCPWMYTCQPNEQVSCTKEDDNDWTCSCETCEAGGSFEFYYEGSNVIIDDYSPCTVGGANTVVLKMPKNTILDQKYESFPTGYSFFSKTKTGYVDRFSLGINNGTAYDLEIKDNGYKNYTWSWRDIDDSPKTGNVVDCEVGDWKRNNTTCELFEGDGALNYPFAWESKNRLRPVKYYVKKDDGTEIDIFKLVTDENKAYSAPSVQDDTFYAFVDYNYRFDNWEKLFDCGNPPDGKCTYDLYAGEWDRWPYDTFSIIYDDNNVSLFIQNSATSGSYWNIDQGFNFNEAFKPKKYCGPGEDVPNKVVIKDKKEDAEWELTASIPENGVLKIAPPYGILFSGFLTKDGINPCPAGYYCIECNKYDCPRAFTSAAGASKGQDCYIKPGIKFTDSSTGSGAGFGLPECFGSGPKCVENKIKVNYNPVLK